MTPVTRTLTAGLIIAAASIVSHGIWAAVATAPADRAARPGPPVVAQGQANGPRVPEIAAPQARGAPAKGPRGDTNANRISDALEARLGEAEPGEKLDVIVVFDVPNGVARSRAAVGPFAVTREFSIINGFQASMTAAQIRALSSVAGLMRIEENAEVKAHDTFLNDDTGATEARGVYGVTGAGVTICVLDTGIFAGHEQFDSKVVDFRDFINGAPEPYDDHWHGTHVAGIAAGDGGGSLPFAPLAIGVAPDASLKIGKVLDASGSGSSAGIIGGIEWCASDPDVSIVSMSLGGPSTDGTDSLSLAVNCASDPSHGGCNTLPDGPKIVVVSAGNSGASPRTIGAPGVAEKAITVGSFAEWSGDPATNWQDDGVYLNPFSSRGPVVDGNGDFVRIKPDIVGVGSRVLSAYVDPNDGTNPEAYAVASGTSMSAPSISGTIALMIEADPSLAVANADGLPHEKVRAVLADTAMDRGDDGPNASEPEKDNEYGWGLVDAYAAVAQAMQPDFYSPTEYPGYTWLPGEAVANSGEWLYPFTLTSNDNLDRPIAGTMTIHGEFVCHWEFFGSCLIPAWDPDLELVVEVRDSSTGNWSEVPADTTGSAEVTRSECPDTGECGGVGRVELVHFIPSAAGDYRFRVYPFSGDPNNGKGGTFDFEISMGAPDSGTGGNDAPVAAITAPADGSSFTEEESIEFSGSASDTEDGDLTDSLAWTSDVDGSIGTGGSVSTSELSVGSHTITASVTDSGGRTSSDSIAVDVTLPDDNLPPTADFSFTTSDLTANFTDASTDSNGTIVSWSWDFGDGGSSTATDPSHTYAAGGTYSVTLTVTDDEEATDAVTKSVTVEPNEPPIASFTVDRDPCGTDFFPNECQFTDSSTDSDGDIVSWDWDFGAGTVVGGIPCCPGHTMQVEFPADGPNPETVSLTVTDDGGATHTASMEVWLSHPAETNDPPMVSITAPADGSSFPEGDSITFTGSASDTEDDDGTLTGSLAWSSSIDGDIGAGGSFSTSALSAGTHTVTASVTDSGGLSGDTSITVTVNAPNEPPDASFTFTTADLAADFTDTSSDSDGSIVSWAWNFGDGASSTVQNPSHGYASGGTYTVTLTVTDDDGDTGAASQSVTVSEPATIDLSAIGYKVRGRHTIDLSWSGSSSTNADIYRDGGLLTTTANDGAYTDSTDNRGGGSYTYQLCEAGTSTCSDQADVVF